MSIKKHALLVTDQEVDFILLKLLDEYDDLSCSECYNADTVKRIFYNRYFVDFDDFYKRCQDVFQIFREEAFK